MIMGNGSLSKRAGDSNASAFAPSRFRGGACDPGRFTLHGRETEKSNLRAFTPTRFPGGDHHLVISSPIEERPGLEPGRAVRPLRLSGALL